MKIFIEIFRWLFLLPAAILSSLLADWVLRFINGISFSCLGYDPEFIISHIYIEFLSHTTLGAMFMYVGVKTAPTNKIIITYFFAIFGFLFCGWIASYSYMVSHYWNLLYVLFIIFGIAFKTYDLLEKLKVDENGNDICFF